MLTRRSGTAEAVPAEAAPLRRGCSGAHVRGFSVRVKVYVGRRFSGAMPAESGA